MVYRGRSRTFENVEAEITYKKLQRTGALLRNNKVRVVGGKIVMSNKSPYAQAQHEGSSSSVGRKAYIKKGGAVRAIAFTDGNVARPWMNPSKRVLVAPKTLLGRKLKSYGW